MAALVGNGLSIAFNADLNLQSITEEVLSRIQSADGDDVVLAMKEIAERALPYGATSAEDFETLVGVFGAESKNLGVFSTLAQLTRPADQKLRESIEQVTEFAEQVRDTGVSHVLEVIAERSHAFIDDAQNLHSFVEAITEAFKGEITFGNLNYDTLLLAAILWVCQPDLADMGHGNKNVEVTVADRERKQVQALRRCADDFPTDRRVKLLHLHGSLTYWATTDEETYAKFPIDMLKDGSQWRAIREQTTSVRPVIVLANQRDKTEHVTKYPFEIAYDMFKRALAKSDHWLVVGYSFGDDPVNAMLRAEFIELSPKPKVLVITYGDQLKRRSVERAFGWGVEDGSSEEWLTINREGANGAQDSDDWQTFIAE